VRGEAPENVLLAPHLAEVEAVGIDVAQAAQGALTDEGAYADEGGVVLQQVADHEDEAALPGLRHQFRALGMIERERLLDEDMLPRRQGLAHHGGVLFGRGGNGDGGDGRIGQHRGPGAGGDAVFGGKRGGYFGPRIDHGRQGAEGGEIAHEIGAPVAAAGDGDPRRS